MVLLITGKAGAGKTHYSNELAKELKEDGYNVKQIDGDYFRDKTNNWDFTDKGRKKNLVKAAKLAKEYEQKGNIVILSFIAPKKEWRNLMQSFWKESKVIYIPGGTLWEGLTYEKPELND